MRIENKKIYTYKIIMKYVLNMYRTFKKYKKASGTYRRVSELG